MGGSAGKSESGASNSFGQQVWNPGAQQDMMGGFQGSYDQNQEGMQGAVPGVADQNQGVFDAANPAWQNQLKGGAYSGMDLQGDYNQAFQGGGNEQFMNEQIMGGAGNNYVDAMKGQMEQDSTDILGRSMAMTDARAAGNQLGGSSRHGLVQADQIQNSNRNLMDAQTKLGYDTFAQDQDRKMGIARNADKFDMDRLNVAGGMLNNQQNVMGGAIDQGQGMQNLSMGGMAPWMAPGQMNQQHAGSMGDPTVLSGGQGDSSSKGAGLSGGMMGGK